MEKLLKKEAKFLWNEECQQILDTLKEKMVIAPILVFPYSNKPFHVHVDASGIALGIVLTQPGEGVSITLMHTQAESYLPQKRTTPLRKEKD